MKSATRPQYHRVQRILELIREGTRSGCLPNCHHFMRELEVSRRTLMRDLDFLRDELYHTMRTGVCQGRTEPFVGLKLTN
jgi:hypothetical protein